MVDQVGQGRASQASTTGRNTTDTAGERRSHGGAAGRSFSRILQRVRRTEATPQSQATAEEGRTDRADERRSRGGTTRELFSRLQQRLRRTESSTPHQGSGEQFSPGDQAQRGAAGSRHSILSRTRALLRRGRQQMIGGARNGRAEPTPSGNPSETLQPDEMSIPATAPPPYTERAAVLQRSSTNVALPFYVTPGEDLPSWMVGRPELEPGSPLSRASAAPPPPVVDRTRGMAGATGDARFRGAMYDVPRIPFRIVHGRLRDFSSRGVDGFTDALAETQRTSGVGDHSSFNSFVAAKPGGDGEFYVLPDDMIVRRINVTPGPHYGGFERFSLFSADRAVRFGPGVVRLPSGTIDFSIAEVGGHRRLVYLKEVEHASGKGVRPFSASLPPEPDSFMAQRERPLENEEPMNVEDLPPSNPEFISAFRNSENGLIRAFAYTGREYSYDAARVGNAEGRVGDWSESGSSGILPGDDGWRIDASQPWAAEPGVPVDERELPDLPHDLLHDEGEPGGRRHFRSIIQDNGGAIWGVDSKSEIWQFEPHPNRSTGGEWRLLGPLRDGAEPRLRNGRIAFIDRHGWFYEEPARDLQGALERFGNR